MSNPTGSGCDLVAPSSQRERADSQVERGEGDADVLGRRQINPWDPVGSSVVGDGDLLGALRFPLGEWLSNYVTFTFGNSTLTVVRRVFAVRLPGTPPSRTPIRIEAS